MGRKKMEKMMMEIMVLWVVFSHIVFVMEAVPLSRSIAFVDQGDPAVEKLNLGLKKLDLLMEDISRVDKENLNDYPGSGPNNRHDPRNP